MADDDLEAVRARLDEWMLEAQELRSAVALPAAESGPTAVVQSLAAVRRNLDRVEGLLAQAGRVRARAQRAHQDYEALAQDKWDEAATRPGRRTGDFTGPRERYADFNLASLDERRNARRAAALASVAEEAYDFLRVVHRGLDTLRQDHHVLIRSITVENQLER